MRSELGELHCEDQPPKIDDEYNTPHVGTSNMEGLGNIIYYENHF